MKTKITLLAIAAIALLSFTFSATSKKETAKTAAKQQSSNTTESGGLAMEDRDQWK